MSKEENSSLDYFLNDSIKKELEIDYKEKSRLLRNWGYDEAERWYDTR